MTHGSLFSGIGGFDLAAEWMGWENVFHCEYDPFCQKVLNHHFPNSKLYEDIKTFDASDYFGRIDLLSGGFPCQPFSAAGLRKGTEDDRHLWPQMLRIIREVSPRYVVGENVRGLINWSGGLVFEQVCADLENEGYEVTPYLLPAAGKNAPHRRDRIWFVAKRNAPDTVRKGFRKCEGEKSTRAKGEPDGHLTEYGQDRSAPDTVRKGHKRSELNGTLNKGVGTRKPFMPTTQQNKIRNWEEFPTQPPICGGNDGIPKELDSITFPKWRNESIKAYGNAIVPQVAHEIFKAIQKMEESFVP